MSLFHYQRGRLVLAIVVMAGVGYLLALGTVFDSLGGIQVPDLTRPFSLSGSVSEPEGGLSQEQAAAKGQDTLAMVMDVTLSVGCQGWDPHGLIEDDPPDCLRAKQLREVQEFRKLDYEYVCGCCAVAWCPVFADHMRLGPASLARESNLGALRELGHTSHTVRGRNRRRPSRISLHVATICCCNGPALHHHPERRWRSTGWGCHI
jgi:hypothetical protein